MIEVTVDTAALSTSRNVGAGRPANPAAAGSCPARLATRATAPDRAAEVKRPNEQVLAPYTRTRARTGPGRLSRPWV